MCVCDVAFFLSVVLGSFGGHTIPARVTESLKHEQNLKFASI